MNDLYTAKRYTSIGNANTELGMDYPATNQHNTRTPTTLPTPVPLKSILRTATPISSDPRPKKKVHFSHPTKITTAIREYDATYFFYVEEHNYTHLTYQVPNTEGWVKQREMRSKIEEVRYWTKHGWTPIRKEKGKRQRCIPHRPARWLEAEACKEESEPVVASITRKIEEGEEEVPIDKHFKDFDWCYEENSVPVESGTVLYSSVSSVYPENTQRVDEVRVPFELSVVDKVLVREDGVYNEPSRKGKWAYGQDIVGYVKQRPGKSVLMVPMVLARPKASQTVGRLRQLLEKVGIKKEQGSSFTCIGRAVKARLPASKWSAQRRRDRKESQA